jgi:hypothetical protein
MHHRERNAATPEGARNRGMLVELMAFRLRKSVPVRFGTFSSALFFALSCARPSPEIARPAADPPLPEPSVAPLPESAGAHDAAAAMDASDAAPADAGAVAVACEPVARPPTIDVYFDLHVSASAAGTSMGPGWSMLRARVRAPAAKLSHQVWESPAPTSCKGFEEAGALRFECLTDEGWVSGRVHVEGEELVIDTERGTGSRIASPVGAPAASPPRGTQARELRKAVPCGSRLAIHGKAKDHF